MTKEQEVVEKLLSFAFAMSENMIGLTKGNYDEKTFVKKTYEYLQKYTVDRNEQKTIRQALNRLEAIDNSEPSEALKCLEYLYSEPVDYNSNDKAKDYETIKQVLIKEQEPKNYLKWEDLVFTVDWKVMTIKMGDTVYKILYRYCYANEEVQLLSEDKKLLCLRLIGRYKYNIQLFNDLHLEVVDNDNKDSAREI